MANTLKSLTLQQTTILLEGLRILPQEYPSLFNKKSVFEASKAYEEDRVYLISQLEEIQGRLEYEHTKIS